MHAKRQKFHKKYALEVNVGMSLFQHQGMTFVMVGHIIIEQNVHHQNILLHLISINYSHVSPV